MRLLMDATAQELRLSATRTLTFLGTGTSVGVPVIGCDCDVCQSPNPRNRRYRSSVLVDLGKEKILIDTTPELRLQLLREKVKVINAVLYTHYHVDHLYGMDDLRMVARHLGGPVPLYCTDDVEAVIRTVFPYVFVEPPPNMPPESVTKLKVHLIDQNPFELFGQKIVPIPLRHSRFNVFGFRFDTLAYCTDVSEIPPESFDRLRGVETLIIDALRFEPHPAHFSLDQALDVIEELKPKRAYLTHMSHELDYDKHNQELPPNVEMAYDGLKIVF
jgi:phosphoribosyl 1,2-cyclic phosphate phosphodiesterase